MKLRMGTCITGGNNKNSRVNQRCKRWTVIKRDGEHYHGGSDKQQLNNMTSKNNNQQQSAITWTESPGTWKNPKYRTATKVTVRYRHYGRSPPPRAYQNWPARSAPFGIAPAANILKTIMARKISLEYRLCSSWTERKVGTGKVAILLSLI